MGDNMDKKVVLITGSSKGIGASTALVFAQNNYNVVINYNKSKQEALELKNSLESFYSIKALTVKCDITKENEVQRMIKSIIKEFGRIDVLINNAAISMDNNILEKEKEEFMKVLEVNLGGTFLVTKEVLNRTKVSTIINVSSTDSIDTYNDLSIDYCASKAGINIITKILAAKFLNIKICAILPNWVNTESVRNMDPLYLEAELKRIGQKTLIDSGEIAREIYDIVVNDKIKSGDLVIIDGK